MGPVTPWGRSYGAGDPMGVFLWGHGRSYGAGDPMRPFLWGR